MTSNWESYAREHRQFYQESVPELLTKHLGKEWEVFLDVGCGEGNLLFSMDRRGLLKNKRVMAIDISSTRLQEVRRVNHSFICHVDDACKLDSVSSESVDRLASLEVIEHVGSDDAMLGQIQRVLKAGGIAYITTVFKNRKAWYIYRSPHGERIIDPTHVREYTDDRLIELCASHGLEVIENRKRQTFKPLLGFFILRIIRAREDALLRHSSLRAARRIVLPVPGYYTWEIVVRKKDRAVDSEGA